MLRRTRNTVMLAALAVAITFVQAPAAQAQVDAVTAPRHDLKLAFTVSGKVDKVLVKPGDRVTAGQTLVELDARETAILVRLYELHTSSDLERKSAEEQLKLATVEYEAIKAAWEKQAANPLELRRNELRQVIAALELEKAGRDKNEMELQLEKAQAQLDRYAIKAPVGGSIEIITVEAGETVKELEPILHMVMTDPLWIDAAVPTEQTRGLKIGDSAWVTSKMVGTQPIEGKIIFLGRANDAASDTKPVRIEVPNSNDQLESGWHVTVSFTRPAVAKADKPAAPGVNPTVEGH